MYNGDGDYTRFDILDALKADRLSSWMLMGCIGLTAFRTVFATKA